MYPYKISVIMPALNEEKCLAVAVSNVLEGFRRYSINGELIVVNDGSSDATGALAEEFSAQQQCVRVLHHETPQGIGASFWNGVSHACGEIVTFIPGDGENDAAEIFRFLPIMDQVDIVVPFVINPGVRPWWRRLLSFTYHQTINSTTPLSLNYLNGTVMYRKAIFKGITLRSRGFFYQTELLVKTIGRNYFFAEVPYFLKTRHSGKSKALSIRSLMEVIRSYCVTISDLLAWERSNIPIVADSATARRMRESAINNGGND